MSRHHWDPKTGEMRIFEDDEKEPAGWLDTHPDNLKLRGGDPYAAKTTPAATAAPALSMTRAEIIAALKGGEIKFNPTASAVALHDVLRNALVAVFAERKIPVTDDLTTKDMLDIVAGE